MNILKRVILSTLLISLAAAQVYAGNHGWGKGQKENIDPQTHLNQIKQALELTPLQETEILAIITEKREGMKPLREKMQTAKTELRTAYQAESLDEAKLRGLASEQADLRVDMMVAQHATRAEIDNLLTAEQQEKWQQFRQQRHEKRAEHRVKGANAAQRIN